RSCKLITARSETVEVKVEEDFVGSSCPRNSTDATETVQAIASHTSQISCRWKFFLSCVRNKRYLVLANIFYSPPSGWATLPFPRSRHLQIYNGRSQNVYLSDLL